MINKFSSYFYLALLSNDKETLNNIRRFMMISFGTLLLLIFEIAEQSVVPGHSPNELIHLIYDGDYLPPSLTGTLCGSIYFCLIFFCNEYRTLTSEWLINIFYYCTGLTHTETDITDESHIKQILKILSMVIGVRLSLWTSKRQETPNIDKLFYSFVGLGSFFSAFSILLTKGTLTDHICLINAFVESLSMELVSKVISVAWFILYFSKLIGLCNLR